MCAATTHAALCSLPVHEVYARPETLQTDDTIGFDTHNFHERTPPCNMLSNRPGRPCR